jgi:LytS/YehU family sensor histidine kinase
MLNKLWYWALQVSGWGLVFAVNEIVAAMFTPQWLVRSLATYGLCSLSGLLLSHGFRIQVKQGWLMHRVEKSLWPYVAAPFVLGTVQTLLAGIFFRIFLVPDTFRRWNWVPSALAIWTAIFIVWTALYVSASQARKTKETEHRRRDAEFAAKDARLAALRNQVNPHFLFNCLNSIRALIFQDSAKAAQMIDKLASMLRYSLGSDQKGIVTLAEELAVVREYLDLETIRFEERLRIETDVDEIALQAILPSMLMQTLVENAVKHGIEPRPGGGTIRIQARLQRGNLQVAISNPGTLKKTSASTRIGLNNAAQQLALSMGTGAKLSLLEQDGVVLAELVIPQDGRH